jgi:quercetin dioxygenase-like cupin family protein
MKNSLKTMMIAGVFAILFHLNAGAQTNGTPKGNRAPAENFTGTVWLNPLAEDTAGHWSMAKVTFEAGAHSKWHTHPDKQVLVITEGTGYLKERGKPIRILHKGDVVTIAPGVEHWHGATPDSDFVQIVTNPNTTNGVVTWLKPVTEREYKNGK